MESVLEMSNNQEPVNHVRTISKKDRVGRWTQSQAYLFETLLERYGKNWKRIHQHMKGRSLSQIRSHGQKFFGKIGVKKVEELERRAKLLDAYETLEKQKRLQQQVTSKSESSEERPMNQMVKIQEDSPATIDNEHAVPEQEMAPEIKPSEFIKEQPEKQSQQISKQAPIVQSQQQPSNFNFCGNGYLINLIMSHPETFRTYGIGGFIDDQRFRSGAGYYTQ